MIDQQTLVTYLAILLGFVLIPGPAVLLTLARSTSAGTRVGLATGLGIAVGDLVHTLMAVIGISTIIMTSAILFTIVKYLGAAYLVYLGIRAILEPSALSTTLPTSVLSAREGFRQAVLAEVLNPKSAMFFLAFLPQFIRPENGSASLQLLILGVLFVLVGLSTTVLVALVSGAMGNVLKRSPVVLKWQGKAVGSIYCGLGLRLALQER